MSQIVIQSSFQFGEVSELLNAQVTSPIYYKAARRLRNVLVIPQGGVKKRFGLEFKFDLGDGIYYNQIKTRWFESSDGKRYYLVFWSLYLGIYYQGEYVTSLVTPYQAQEIIDLNLAQSSDLMIIVHANHEPAILKRDINTDVWTLNEIPKFINFPQYDFKQDYYNYYFRVLRDVTYSPPGGTWNIYTRIPITTATNVVGERVFIGVYDQTMNITVDYFDQSAIDGFFYMSGGIVKITGITTIFSAESSIPAYVAEGVIVQTFTDNTINFISGELVIKQGNEVVFTQRVFSNENGWPQNVSFFQNRVWFGNTKKLPAGIWGSNYNGYSYNSFNFNETEGLATSAIGTILAGEKNIIIRHIVSYKTLVVLTNQGLYSTPLFSETPITPSNIQFINKQSADASNKVPAVILDNDVVFSIQGGNRIKNLTVTTQGYNYKTNTLTTLCPHLIDNPISIDTYQNSSVEDGNWLFVVNDGKVQKGTLAVYQNVPEQEITAWTLCTTKEEDYFRAVTSIDDDVYFLVERTYNGRTHLHAEALNFNLNTDNTILISFETPTSAITGLNELAGEDVQVIIDGSPAGILTVDITGILDAPYAGTNFEIGLPYYPLIQPMPLNFPAQMGNSLYLPKTIKMIYLDYYNTTGITVNGNLIEPFQTDLDTLDTPPPLKKGFTKVEPFNGWEPRQIINISQDVPRSFTLIGIGYIVTI